MKKIFTILLLMLTLLSVVSCYSSTGDVKNVEIDYGKSTLYSKQDMDSAIDVIKEQFISLRGFKLNTVTYVGDETSLEYAEYYYDKGFDEYIVFNSSFHTAKHDAEEQGFNSDSLYENWYWYLGRNENGKWQKIDCGIS